MSIAVDAGDDITCTFENDKEPPGQIAVDKQVRVGSGAYGQGPAQAGVGSTLGYLFEVTNPGAVALIGVTLSDSRCDAGTLSGPVKAVGDADDDLEPGEMWTWTCTHVLTASDPQPFENTATATGTDPAGGTVTDSDTAVATFIAPAVAIDKTGPATGTAGERFTYTLVVTNPGTVAIVGETVAVTDPLCEAPPALQSKRRDGAEDATPASLDPGDAWTYTCTVQSQPGQERIDNVATVTGSDGHTSVTASDTQVTTLEQPPASGTSPVTQAAAPNLVVFESSRLTAPSGCRPKRFRVSVEGVGISQVAFYIDGKLYKRVLARSARKARASQAGAPAMLSFRALIYPKRYKPGTHEVTAKIRFVANARRPARNLVAAFQHCARRVIKPQFTG